MMTSPSPTPPKEPLGQTMFRPLWVRILVTVFVAGWAAWEWLYSKDQFWGILTLGMLGWAVYTFFIAPDKKPGDGGPKP
jgi:hypothetical protein